MVSGVELLALSTPGECSTNELHPKPYVLKEKDLVCEPATVVLPMQVPPGSGEKRYPQETTQVKTSQAYPAKHNDVRAPALLVLGSNLEPSVLGTRCQCAVHGQRGRGHLC